MSAIETGVRNTLNAGIGLFRAAEENLGKLGDQIKTAQGSLETLDLNAEIEKVKAQVEGFDFNTQITTIQKQLEDGYADLVSKGAADQSELVVNLRGLLDQGIAQVKEIQAQVDSYLKN